MAEYLLEKVKIYCNRNRLLQDGDHIIVGVSGGADSVCLFFLLLELQKEISFQIRVVHVHHGIRKEADQDLQYVQQICMQNHVVCQIYRENIPEMVKRTGMTEEEAGRRIRYQDFEETKEKWKKELLANTKKEIAEKYFKIATAHHRDDQAETILFQLFRGSGIPGLCGIWPQKDRIIRPVLCLGKEEMEQYLEEKKISFCQDKTNFEEKYSRNKIRHTILPYVEKEICHGVAEHLAQTAERMQEADLYLQNLTQKAFEQVGMIEGTKLRLNLTAFNKMDFFIRKQLLLYSIERMTEARKDITSSHIQAILALTEKQGNGSLSLPYDLCVEKMYEKLYFYKKEAYQKEGKVSLYDDLNRVPKQIWDEVEPKITFQKIENDQIEKAWDSFRNKGEFRYTKEGKSCGFLKNNATNLYTQFIDYDKIKVSLTVRHRQTGDYYVISADGHRKSLKKYLMDAKIPKEYRDRIWLVADGSCVVWIPGLRLGENYKITEQTVNTMRIEFEGGR